MNKILNPHYQYAVAYIDDIIYSPTWEDHLQYLREVLKALQETGLTANLAKCKVVLSKVTYLEYCIGGGLVKAVIDKVEALTACHGASPRRRGKSDVFLVWQDITRGLSLALPQSRS